MVKHSPLYLKVKGLSHAVAGTKRENGGTNSRETINTRHDLDLTLDLFAT
jgi:hypothetical protein